MAFLFKAKEYIERQMRISKEEFTTSKLFLYSLTCKRSGLLGILTKAVEKWKVLTLFVVVVLTVTVNSPCLRVTDTK